MHRLTCSLNLSVIRNSCGSSACCSPPPRTAPRSSQARRLRRKRLHPRAAAASSLLACPGSYGRPPPRRWCARTPRSRSTRTRLGRVRLDDREHAAGLVQGHARVRAAGAPRRGQQQPARRQQSPAWPRSRALQFINPVVGGTYVFKLSPDFKLAAFLGLTVPIGGGGGDSPIRATRPRMRPASAARSAMDNAMFAVNYFTVFPGLDLAYVTSGLTVQVEATFFQLFRVRGKDGRSRTMTRRAPISRRACTSVTSSSRSSPLGAELRHQRWLSTPSSIKAGL